MATKTLRPPPPELAHRRVYETDSMTLSIGSIFGGQHQPSRNAPFSMITERDDAPVAKRDAACRGGLGRWQIRVAEQPKQSIHAVAGQGMGSASRNRRRRFRGHRCG